MKLRRCSSTQETNWVELPGARKPCIPPRPIAPTQHRVDAHMGSCRALHSLEGFHLSSRLRKFIKVTLENELVRPSLCAGEEGQCHTVSPKAPCTWPSRRPCKLLQASFREEQPPLFGVRDLMTPRHALSTATPSWPVAARLGRSRGLLTAGRTFPMLPGHT